MLARSTACRDGWGESMKATLISSRWPLRTSRLAGLTSRWARPGLRQLADDRQAVNDHLVVDLGLAQLDRAVEELDTSRYSCSGVS